MSTFLSDEIHENFAVVPPCRPARTRLRVRFGASSWPVLRMTVRGFVMEGGAPLMPGRVDIYDGERHLMQGLAMRGDEVDGEVAYEFKWCAEPRPSPPRDFVPDGVPEFEPRADRPMALMTAG